MQALLDKNVPVQVRGFLQHHTVDTAARRGWDTLSNGLLLDAAEKAGFDVLVTGDQAMYYEQNMAKRRIALVVLDTNRWRIIRAHPQLLVQAVDRATPGSYQVVAYPRPPRPPRPNMP